MKTKRMKWLAALGGALGLGWAGNASAYVPVWVSSDSLTITITPTTDLGVDVDTTTTRLNDTDTPGTMSLSMQLGATAYFVSPATVTILGTFNNQEVQLKAACLDSWAIDADETAEADKVQVYALFSTLDNSVPTEAQFAQGGDYRHLVTGTPKWAGESLGSENNDTTDNVFEIPSSLPFSGGTEAGVGGGSDMDRLQVGNIRQLYLRVDAPPSSSVSAEQEIQVTLTADSGVGH